MNKMCDKRPLLIRNAGHESGIWKGTEEVYSEISLDFLHVGRGSGCL